MTTEQRMRTNATISLLCGALLMCAGCEVSQGPVMPATLAAPYDADGDVLWVVLPLANESGASVVDPLLVTDALIYQIQQTHGLSAVPLNRTIAAMRAEGLGPIDTPADAVILARTLGADAVLVGAVTAWDPYDPPEIGMSLALYPLSPAAASGRDTDSGFDLNPRALVAASSDYGLPASDWATPTDPASAVSEHLDGANNELLLDLRRYAAGRHDPHSALGWRRYTASMSLFTEYACHRLTERLLIQEHRRLTRARAAAQE